MAQRASLRQYVGDDNNVPSLVFPRSTLWTKLIQKNETQQEIRRVLPIYQGIAYWFCFTGVETEIHKIKDNSKIKREKNIERHGQRESGNVWHLPDPPSFSLPTTFNRTFVSGTLSTLTDSLYQEPPAP
jgi:hypothetical protein